LTTKSKITNMSKGVRDFPKFKNSPFFVGVMHNVKKGNKTVAIGTQQFLLFDAKTGAEEKNTTAFMGVRKVVDKGQFTKVYLSAINALFELTPKAQKVFSFFMTAQQMNDHQVYFSPERCAELTGYKSPRSIYEGLAELLEKEFIARATDTNFFYINPEICFNGNRLVQFQDWIVKGSDVHKALIQQEKEDAERVIRESQIEMFPEGTPEQIEAAE
jgi:hypothetical protein